jgi:hypothetical protein
MSAGRPAIILRRRGCALISYMQPSRCALRVTALPTISIGPLLNILRAVGPAIEIGPAARTVTSQQTLTLLNGRAVIDELVQNGPSTVAELQLRTGISKPPVTDAMERLSRLGLASVRRREKDDVMAGPRSPGELTAIRHSRLC